MVYYMLFPIQLYFLTDDLQLCEDYNRTTACEESESTGKFNYFLFNDFNCFKAILFS